MTNKNILEYLRKEYLKGYYITYNYNAARYELRYIKNPLKLTIHIENGELTYEVHNAATIITTFRTTIEDPNSIPELLKAIKTNPILYTKQKLPLEEYYLYVIYPLLLNNKFSNETETAIKALNNSELEAINKMLYDPNYSHEFLTKTVRRAWSEVIKNIKTKLQLS